MFIQKITIYNLLAYYGRVEVDFIRIPNKNLYCIYGYNGYGKTSFISCAKLLFLGSGILESSGKIPDIIAKFSGELKKHTPLALMKGNKHWSGIFNKYAFNNGEDTYFVEFKGEIDNTSFTIKREWKLLNHRNEMSENLTYKIGDRFYQNEDAQYEINKILPSNFVEFFFFDSEEIESMSENLHKSLKEKITAILQITPLEMIIKQIQNLKDELQANEIKNIEEKNKLNEKTKELDTENTRLKNLIDEIQYYENIRIEKQQQYANKEKEINKLIANQSQKHAKLEKQRLEIQEDIAKNKSELLNMLPSVVFVANNELLKHLKQEIAQADNKANKNDIQSYIRLLPYIKTTLFKDLKITQDSNANAYNRISNSLDSMPHSLEKDLHNSNLPLHAIKDIESMLIRLESNTLAHCIKIIQKAKIDLQDTKDEIKELNLDDSTKIKEENLKEEMQNIESKLQEIKEILDSKRAQKILLANNIEIIQNDINTIKQRINTQRINNKLEMLDKLKYYISTYKQRLVVALKEELKTMILQNYKTLLPNDNISDLEINDDFEVILRNIDNEMINIASQSSGQKQILAMAIFWALSKLSHSNIPLIIDTPLGIIDKSNRKRIIQQYYANNASQVIILPHDGEMGKEEYEYAKAHLAGLYQIKNKADRGHATIIEANITDIFH